MKYLLLSLFISGSAFAAEKPSFTVPADAAVSDVLCSTSMTKMSKTDIGWSPWTTVETRESSVSQDWEQDGFSYNLEEGEGWLSFNKIQREKLDELTTKTIVEQDNWSEGNDGWTKDSRRIERISTKAEGYNRVVEYRIDGNLAPYYWDNYHSTMGEKQFLVTSIHRNPSARNTEFTKYSRYFMSCLFTER